MLFLILNTVFEKIDENFLDFQKFLDQKIEGQKISSIVNYVEQDGKVVFSSKSGFQDVENKIPIEFNTIFRIFSMTKPITCVSALILYESNKLGFEDKVSKYIPEFKNLRVFVSEQDGTLNLEDMEREPTIKDLFCHTAGLTYGFDPNNPIDKMYVKSIGLLTTSKDFNLEELVSKIVKIPLRFQPGSRWHYSYSHDVLGRIIEIISGKTLDAFMQEFIIKPLHMKDTGYYVPENQVNRLSKFYTRTSKGEIKELNIPNLQDYTKPPVLFRGGSGLVSTLSDYITFCKLLLNKGSLNGIKILLPETIKLMTQNHLAQGQYVDIMDSTVGYGLGVGVFVEEYENIPKGIYTWGGAAGTQFWIDPVNNLFGIYLIQYMGNEQVMDRFDYTKRVISALE